MKRKIVLLVFSFFSINLYAQVKIGENPLDLEPTAVLELESTSKGFLPPRLTEQQMNDIVTPADGLIVFCTDCTESELYFFNDNQWQPVCYLIGGSIIGDVKQGFHQMDHNGWIKLDGRATNTLTPTQQSNALLFGFTTNIPDASGSVLMQNSNPPGSVSGTMNKIISQANLPNINFPTATTNSTGSHTHGNNAPGGNGQFGIIRRSNFGENVTIQSLDTGGSGFEPDLVTTPQPLSIFSDGVHSHQVTVSSGGSGSPLDITPRNLSVNCFIYLGQ